MQPVAHDQTLDWITAISTAVAAFGTLAAVLVTLYFNVWRPKRRQPRLSLDFNEESGFNVSWTPGDSDGWWGLTLSVTNARGRQTAHEVQVFADLAVAQGDVAEANWTDFWVQQPLVWQFGRAPAGVGQQKTDIAPGLARRFFVVFIGDANRIYHDVLWPPVDRTLDSPAPIVDPDTGQEYDSDGNIDPDTAGVAGALARFPFQKEDVLWLYHGRDHRFRFTIVARDVDAVMYEVSLRLDFEVKDKTRWDGSHNIVTHWGELKTVDPKAAYRAS